MQVARSFLQHVAAITGGELDDFGPQIELEDLLEIYGFSLPDCRGCKCCRIIFTCHQALCFSLALPEQYQVLATYCVSNEPADLRHDCNIIR